jgi:hypothetical protein
MRAHWLTLLVMIVGAALAKAEPEATCAAACQRYVQCKLSSAEACVAACKRAAVEATPEGRARLVAMVRASCDQLAATQNAQTQPASRAQPGSQAQPASQPQPGSQTQPAPRASLSPRTPPAPRAQPAPRTPPAPRTQPAQPASPVAPESDKHLWRCTSEGSYEVLGQGEIYWRAAPISMFDFGKTQQVAIIAANARCSNQMTGMMAIQSVNMQTRIKTPCRPTRCMPPP